MSILNQKVIQLVQCFPVGIHSITESFSMTKIHKDIAMRLMEVVNDEEYTEQQVVKVCCSPIVTTHMTWVSHTHRS